MVTMIVVSLLLGGCSTQQKQQPKEVVIPVKTVDVKKQELSIPVHTSGRLYPKAMVKLSFKVGGLIDKLHVDEGDTVKKGQLLATLDLSEIKARFNQAKNGWEKAQRDLERAQNLHNDRAATLEQLQNAKTAFQVAEANLKIAQFNLDYSKIKAPAKGKILKRLSEAAEMTGQGTPVFLFGSTENNWVIKTGVSERDLVRLKLQDKATVAFDAYPGKEFSARVTEISESIDVTGGSYEVEVAVDAEGLKLAAGFVGKVDIEPSETSSYYVIPVDSIVEGEGNDGVVFTAKDGKAVRLNIKVAHIFPTRVAVRTGLEKVRFVVTSGAAYLTGGCKVKVK